MDIVIKISLIGIITAICSLVIRQRQEYAILLGVVGGLIILLLAFDYFFEIFDFMQSLVDITGIDNSIISAIIKIVGTGYIIDFSADVATDISNDSLAKKIVFGGKVIIFCLIIPILTELLNIITSMLN